MRLSVNILNWNCKNVLKDTLEVLETECFDNDFEVIVVDNGSKDGSIEFLKGKQKVWVNDNLHIISNRKNLGISKGKNQGIEKSIGDYVLLLDADVLPVKNSIFMLMDYLDHHDECQTIGFKPNKWQNQKNTEHCKFHEDYCHTLFEPRTQKAACLFYGMYRRWLFDMGLRLREDGVFGEVGYGWEDHDFYLTMKEMGVDQWVAHMNKANGRYYHAINSSINNYGCMGKNKYQETSKARGIAFHKSWD